MTLTTPAPRLAILFARKAPLALVLRRGPSKWVQLIAWDVSEDRLERGPWFHGRIYERRSDLSPDGRLFVYFASKFNRRTLSDPAYTYAWTAVSRPPWLTALALWPKGDCWWGGGLFSFNRTLMLNHRPGEDVPHPDHRPKGLRVSSNPEAAGEDDPLYSQRLQRDGWSLKEDWDISFTLRTGFKTERPQVRERRHPTAPLSLLMHRAVSGYRKHDRFFLVAPHRVPRDLRAQWADWDQRGRLVLLGSGLLSVASVTADGPGAPTVLLDTSQDRPAARTPPDWAREWPW